ncbi:hypothetical protein FOA43_003155 [Brettanomyces nanus]|uniref:CNH domain-containing protein n=1 Tax=Eeniella nana TaxID=13502 RepID=A0A875S9T3_EENNA|nr:uncharacterized protein FOA43_003155 [Brettanomyces nanus]QPG75794.1 hypothetical protein FOA43_003155 [Brettanomyces nanus]
MENKGKEDEKNEEDTHDTGDQPLSRKSDYHEISKNDVIVTTKESDDAVDQDDASVKISLRKPSFTITPGPYKLTDFIGNIMLENPEFLESNGAEITCLEAWDQNVYIGTSTGELIHMYRVDDRLGYIQISRQRFNSNKVSSIKKMLLLPEISKILVLSGRTMSAYILPELSPANIGRLRDVSDMVIDYDTMKLDTRKKNYTSAISHINGEVYLSVMVFTSKSIRLVRIFEESIKLFKEVHYVGSVTGVQRSAVAAVATQTNYDLVDVNQSQKIPLFPTCSGRGEDGNTVSLMPFVIPVGKKEFLMVCGGQSAEEPAVAMVVNSSGDVSRGTIPWKSYPVSVAVDYPYVIAIFDNGEASIHSLHSQLEVQRIIFDSQTSAHAFGVKSVFRIFEIKDAELTKALTKRPIISQMTPEELEKIVLESDLAQTNLIKSSCLLYNADGSFVKIFQRYPQPLRWIDLYKGVNKQSFQNVFDELIDELEEETSGRDSTEGQIILSLLAFLSLKYYSFNQAFDILSSNMSHLDPRLVIYIVDGSKYKQIYGSVWEFDGLIGFIEQLKIQYAANENEAQVCDFMQLYLNVCIASPDTFPEGDKESIMKTIEIYLLNLSLDTEDPIDLHPLLMNLKYGSREAIEILLLRKRYYFLSNLYSSLNDHEQSLYYLKGLITGDFNDVYYHKHFPDLSKALQFLVNYLLAHCSAKENVVKSYLQWLLEGYPEYGFKVVTDKRVESIDFNDVGVLHSFEEHGRSDLKAKYLEYMLGVKKKKQFRGDVILAVLDELLNRLQNDEGLVKQIELCMDRYSKLKVPKMSFQNFWAMEKKLNTVDSSFSVLHNKLYSYLSKVTSGTVSVLSQCSVLERCEKEIVDTKYGQLLPLISMMIHYKKGDLKTVIIELCNLGDFKTAEQVATTLALPELGKVGTEDADTESERKESEDAQKVSEGLLLLIFDVYLNMGNTELIDSFLSHHNLLQDDTREVKSVLERMDKFAAILQRIPDNFPLLQLQNFLKRSLLEFHDYQEVLVLQKSLYRSRHLQMKGMKESLEDK